MNHTTVMDRRDFLRLSSVGAVGVMNLNVLNQAVAAQPSKKGPQPVMFIGHGSPMNIIRDNRFTRHLHDLGKQTEKPAAVLMVSAHWLTPGSTSVSVNPKPQTIYDFGGFPDELYQVKYGAPGQPALARDVTSEVRSLKVHEDHEMGLDHGAWSILHHIWPEADVPVFQLSIDYAKPPAFHLELGKQLPRLRNKGVLIIGSGNIVHNLRRISWAEDEPNTPDWALEFDAWAKARLEAGDYKGLADYASQGTAARMAVPTNDHYLPLLYSLGALNDEEQIKFTYEGFQNGSISMRCLQSTA